MNITTDICSPYQAIVTKYLGPSNVRGSRVKATAEAGSITLSWDHSLNADGNHLRAAQALRDKFGWKGILVAGGLPKNAGYCFVMLYDHDKVPGAFLSVP